MRYFLKLSYNGKAYHGWQKQPNAITIQEVLEHTLTNLTQQKVEIVGAGRTDTGVHAKEMYAHFDCNSLVVSTKFLYHLNSFLPKDIAVQKIAKVTSNAHARFDALSRTYQYRISHKKDVFNFNNSYYIPQELDIKKMQEAAHILLQHTNFKSFSKTHTNVKTYNCTITKATFTSVGEELHFTITANRFLRNMVRAIVGTLVEIGTGKIEVAAMSTIIQLEDRSEAGYSVPAHALYLSKIEYPNTIWLPA